MFTSKNQTVVGVWVSQKGYFLTKICQKIGKLIWKLLNRENVSCLNYSNFLKISWIYLLKVYAKENQTIWLVKKLTSQFNRSWDRVKRAGMRLHGVRFSFRFRCNENVLKRCVNYLKFSICWNSVLQFFFPRPLLRSIISGQREWVSFFRQVPKEFIVSTEYEMVLEAKWVK